MIMSIGLLDLLIPHSIQHNRNKILQLSQKKMFPANRLLYPHRLYPTTTLQYMIIYRIPGMMVATLPAMPLQECINQREKKK